jgi:hypothetical protein
MARRLHGMTFVGRVAGDGRRRDRVADVVHLIADVFVMFVIVVRLFFDC